MKKRILHPKSLLETLDRFNEAVFWGHDWESEAADLAEWISGRLGEPRAYSDSFAMTEGDWRREFRLFTGERISTRAGRSHVIAEEAGRALRLVETALGEPLEALRQSEARLGERIIRDPCSIVREKGEYCCGPCSVALWRYLNVGGFASLKSSLAKGVRHLEPHRVEGGGWRRFPFYYTCLALVEVGSPAARRELTVHQETCARRLRTNRHRRDRYALRRSELMRRVLELPS